MSTHKASAADYKLITPLTGSEIIRSSTEQMNKSQSQNLRDIDDSIAGVHGSSSE